MKKGDDMLEFLRKFKLELVGFLAAAGIAMVGVSLTQESCDATVKFSATVDSTGEGEGEDLGDGE